MAQEEQQNRFREIANAVLDQVDTAGVRKTYEKALSLMTVDPTKYLGDTTSAVIKGIQATVENMTTMSADSIVTTILKLYSLSGKYSFVGGKSEKSPAQNLIEINYENQVNVKAEFSEDYTQIQFAEAKKRKSYVQIPKSVAITMSQNGAQLVKFSINIETNVTTFKKLDMGTIELSVATSLEVSGYAVNIERIFYQGGTAEFIVSFSKDQTAILRQVISVAGIQFDGVTPQGAGAASYELDLLGQMQVKASVANINKLMEDSMMADEYYKDEVKFKSIVADINEQIETGVYFSGELKQSWIEFYPMCRNNGKEESWYITPVLVLADGTRFEDPSGFFSPEYYKDILTRAQELIAALSEIAYQK